MAKVKAVNEAHDETDVAAQALAAIAKSTAYLALHAAQLTEADLATQAGFLARLGLTRSDSASVLDSSSESIRVAMYEARKRQAKGGRRG
jgi:hypothetical protein